MGSIAGAGFVSVGVGARSGEELFEICCSVLSNVVGVGFRGDINKNGLVIDEQLLRASHVN